MKFAFFLFLFPIISLACPASFIGRYDGLHDSQFLSKFDSVEIVFNENSLLTFTYNYKNEWNKKFTETYIADGQEHEGNGRSTGVKYTVHCEAEKILVRREFSNSTHPLVYQFSYVGEELHLVESFEGTEYSRLAARFKKTN